MNQDIINALMAYMAAQGWAITQAPSTYNIVYVEGANYNLEPNNDAPDQFNDRRLLIDYARGQWRCRLNAAATTEPGLSATLSTAAAGRGGVFRIKLGQQKACWVIGCHKRRSNHPALVQNLTAEIWGYRDANRDGLRTGERLVRGTGINQHGTSSELMPTKVGNWSEGCLVGQNWSEHMQFMEMLGADARYLNSRWYAFDTTVIDATAFAAWRKSQPII